MTIALFGLISCFLLALEKSIMMVKYLMSDFLLIEVLKLSIIIFLSIFFC